MLQTRANEDENMSMQETVRRVMLYIHSISLTYTTLLN